MVGEEAEWLMEIFIKLKLVLTISLHYGSTLNLLREYNGMCNDKSKYIALRHDVWELLTNGVTSVEYIRWKTNLANPFINGLARK